MGGVSYSRNWKLVQAGFLRGMDFQRMPGYGVKVNARMYASQAKVGRYLAEGRIKSKLEQRMAGFGMRTQLVLQAEDYIAPTLRGAVIAGAVVTAYRKAASEMLKTEWQKNILHEYTSGPSRWPPYSPSYARQKGSYIPTLYARGDLAQNVTRGRDAVSGGHGVKTGAETSLTIDVMRQFKSTPYVWFHEWGNARLPVRDFIKRALERTAPALAGLTVTEPIVLMETLRGAATRTPAFYDNRMGGYVSQGTLSWGWMTRWFSSPMWWVVPPSKALLYFGIFSDVKSILVSGLAVERMIIPYVSAWAMGMSAAQAGFPGTKKSTRRRFRKALWRR
jgi:hypothetical protein